MIITSLDLLGEQIRERRLKLGLTQGELAEQVGSTRQWLSRLERGQEGASVQRLLIMCDVLDLRFTLEMPNREELHPEAPRAERDESASASVPEDHSYSDELRAKAEAAIAERISYRAPEKRAVA